MAVLTYTPIFNQFSVFVQTIEKMSGLIANFLIIYTLSTYFAPSMRRVELVGIQFLYIIITFIVTVSIVILFGQGQ